MSAAARGTASITNLSFYLDGNLVQSIPNTWGGGVAIPLPDQFSKHTATVVATVCKQSGLERKLAAFERGAEKGAISLLAAFYVRQAGFAAGESSFEFTHKSFGEFLVARRLVRALRTIVRELTDRERELDDGWDKSQALAHWAELTGPTSLDYDLFAFLERLRSQGAAIIYITHRLDEVHAISDRVQVLRDGFVAAEGETGGFDRRALVEAMIGHAAAGVVRPPARSWELGAEPMLKLNGASCNGRAIPDISADSGLRNQGSGDRSQHIMSSLTSDS